MGWRNIDFKLGSFLGIHTTDIESRCGYDVVNEEEAEFSIIYLIENLLSHFRRNSYSVVIVYNFESSVFDAASYADVADESPVVERVHEKLFEYAGEGWICEYFDAVGAKSSSNARRNAIVAGFSQSIFDINPYGFRHAYVAVTLHELDRFIDSLECRL